MNVLRKSIRPFAELAASPRGLWYVLGAFVVESTAYFGILTLMTTYFSKDLHWPDTYAGLMVSLFTMLVTLFMLGVGSFAESFGLRRAIAAALLLSTVGRAVYCLLPGLSNQAAVAGAAVLSLLIVAAGSGILQPTCYSGVKQFTDEKTSSMGYAMIYALMNLGIVVIGALSAWVRPGVQAVLDEPDSAEPANGFFQWLASFSASGVQAVNWLCCGITGLTLVGFLVLMTRKTEAARLRPDVAPPAPPGPKPSRATRFCSYLSEGPFGNARFLFFIFMLLPVRTLFAHQWLTMPEYILRSYPKEVGDKMEWLVNWINPLIIFVGVPLATMLTRRFHVYTMMIAGSLVSAVPTFLLCFGPDLKLLIGYFVLFSVGEALWSARFLEYASELAPPGRVAQYMGLAQVPWLLAKGTTGLYSGYLLATYCPPDTPPDQLHTGALWLVYGLIAMTSPIGLWLARGWVQRGLHQPK
jgi:proton-dependent oligopeptide transporter, POT family